MRRALSIVAEGGWLSVVLLLPLWFNPYARVPFEPAKIMLFWVITAVMALAWLGSRRPSMSAKQVSAPGAAGLSKSGRLLIWTVVVYAVVVLLATVTSVSPKLSLISTADNPRGAITIVAGALFFLLVADMLRRPDQVVRLIKVLILASVPVIVYGFAQTLGLDPLAWISDSVSPVHATLGRSNYLGAYLAMVAPWTLAVVLMGTRYGLDGHASRGATAVDMNGPSAANDEMPPASRRFLLILLLQVACLLLTLARGAWLGLTVGCVVLLAVLAIRWRERRFWLAAAVALAVGGAVLIALTFVHLPAGSQQAISAEITYPELRTESALRRNVIWQHALALVPARWPLGYGPATFEQVFSVHYPPGSLYQGTDVVVDDPHNLLLERLLATGFLGLAAFTAVIIAFCKTAAEAWRRRPGRSVDILVAAAVASVAAYLVQAQFNPDVVTLSMLFWLTLAIMVALGRMSMPANH
ncbi:MAG: O-antigen ligase family protein [Anaerolineae bacterium]|nr:O-antigen ligase family protein [Anaerolineae bacterium]